MHTPWTQKPRPLVALAPMDGYTDSAFRRVCKTINADLIVFTEFTSIDGLHFAKEKVQTRFRFSPEEQPIIAQIFGNNLENFVEAARYCEAQGFAGVDVNMGCPARHVVKSEQGVALRRTPEKAFAIVNALAHAVTIPISIKTRLGIADASDLLSFGKGLQDAGAALVTIHGRTYDKPYTVPADLEPVYALQEALAIPVIGNGGISSFADGMAKCKNLAGFMIGRAALGNPWVFSPNGPPSFAERAALIKQHVAWMVALKGLDRARLEIRKHLIAYVKGIPRASAYRSRLARVETVEEIDEILDAMRSET